jgi:pSer/pThr/pTyr-binding forkhead associated (FHA) protein
VSELGKSRPAPNPDDEDTLGMDQTLLASNPDRSLLVTGQRDEMRYLLPECGTVTLGRGSNATIRLDHPSVSRIHAKLSMTSAGVTVEDNGSHNGTLVNGRHITGPCLLRSGDVLAVAAVALLYEIGDGGSAQIRNPSVALRKLGSSAGRFAQAAVNELK